MDWRGSPLRVLSRALLVWTLALPVSLAQAQPMHDARLRLTAPVPAESFRIHVPATALSGDLDAARAAHGRIVRPRRPGEAARNATYAGAVFFGVGSLIMVVSGATISSCSTSSAPDPLDCLFHRLGVVFAGGIVATGGTVIMLGSIPARRRARLSVVPTVSRGDFSITLTMPISRRRT